MTQNLQHRGYEGSVKYSIDDRMLHGRVLGIRDMISYGGKDEQSLEINFRDAVDSYLTTCIKIGKKQNVAQD